MAVQSRSRAARSVGEKREAHPPRTHSPSPFHSHSHTPTDGNVEEDRHDRPTKKQKLSIRGRQTTLDSFAFAPSAQARPPSKVSVAQPHGQLVETINGVQNVLDADEDELSLPASGIATPQHGRVPKPAVQQQTKQEDKRTLRSQDEGPRLKSELAIYFPNYEDIIFDVPRPQDFLTGDSALYITDDAPKQPNKPEGPSPGKGNKKAPPRNGLHPPSTPNRNSNTHLNGSPSLNLDLISRTLPDRPQDPLTSDHYLKSHRRAERKEKQLRNIEKERAMHEKVQLDRLLDGLQGHDWLKVLGITGITDGEAKKYEAKRDYFIAEVQALVDKFKEWKEQEKRQRVDKEATVVAVPAKDQTPDGVEEEEAVESPEGSVGPPSSDLNASASRQLQQETFSALKSSTSKPALKTSTNKEPAATTTPRPPVTFAPPPPPPVETPITSFYTKRHLRDAALGKARSHGRNVTAFGHPVPELSEREFELSEDLLTQDTLAANAREKRRRKRESASGQG